MRTLCRYACLIVCCAPLLAGCELFPHFTNTKNEKVDKEPIAGAPGKHNFRVSQFVFLSDVPINQIAPCTEVTYETKKLKVVVPMLGHADPMPFYTLFDPIGLQFVDSNGSPWHRDATHLTSGWLEQPNSYLEAPPAYTHVDACGDGGS